MSICTVYIKLRQLIINGRQGIPSVHRERKAALGPENRQPEREVGFRTRNTRYLSRCCSLWNSAWDTWTINKNSRKLSSYSGTFIQLRKDKFQVCFQAPLFLLFHFENFILRYNIPRESTQIDHKSFLHSSSFFFLLFFWLDNFKFPIFNLTYSFFCLSSLLLMQSTEFFYFIYWILQLQNFCLVLFYNLSLLNFSFF